MKNYYILFLIFILFFAVIRCTKDNQTINGPEGEEPPPPPDYSDSFDFYPLDIGNYWHYFKGKDSTSYSIEIIGDTILPNNMVYRVFEKIVLTENPDTSYYFERLDTTTSCVYRLDTELIYEYKLDSLAAQKDDYFTGYRYMTEWLKDDFTIRCINVDTTDFLGEQLPQKEFRHISGTDLPSYDLVKGVGVVRMWFFRSGEHLLYAKIRGKEYSRVY